jgi:hypothetical protein
MAEHVTETKMNDGVQVVVFYAWVMHSTMLALQLSSSPPLR